VYRASKFSVQEFLLVLVLRYGLCHSVGPISLCLYHNSAHCTQAKTSFVLNFFSHNPVAILIANSKKALRKSIKICPQNFGTETCVICWVNPVFGYIIYVVQMGAQGCSGQKEIEVKIPTGTHDTAPQVHGMAWVWQIGYRTRTCRTHLSGTMGLPIPMANPKHG